MENSSNHSICAHVSCTKYGVVSFPHEHSELQHLDTCYKERLLAHSFSQGPLLSSDNLVDIDVIHVIKWTRPSHLLLITHSCVVLVQTRPHISDHINTLTSYKHVYSAPTDKTLGLVVVH